jgi:hypothetical protein
MIRDVLPNGMPRADDSQEALEALQVYHLRGPIDAAAAARAVVNIATWRGYLPEDCVKAMIRDGWHLST